MNGSSTAALACGLALNPRKAERKIHAFDRFIKSWSTLPGEPLESIPQGGDFFDHFSEATEPWRNLIQAYRCDITTFTWTGGPIEYLLVDLMKSWKTCQAVTELFFPCLLERDALVVHQDFLHYYTPWIHLVMFRLRNSLIPVFEVPESSTMVFRKEAPLGLDDCRQACVFDGVSCEEVEEAFAWSESIIAKNSKAGLRAAKAMFFCHYANRIGQATGSERPDARWIELAINKYRAIEPEFSGHREVLNAGEFIEAAAGLRVPTSAAPTGQLQTLKLGTYEGAIATMTTTSNCSVRVEIQQRSEGPAWHVQLVSLPMPVGNGRRYRVSFRARSDAPRSISLLAVESLGSSSPLGLAQNLDLVAEWRSFCLDFTATKGDEAARLRFNLGSSDVAVELAEIRFAPSRIPLSDI